MIMNKLAFLFVVNSFEREHLGIMRISSLLRQHHFDVFAAEANSITLSKKLRELTRNYQIVVVGYSLPTVFAPFYLKLNRQLKNNFNFISLFGGPHPTFSPEMIEEEGVDIICRGEGEYPSLELVQRLSNSLLIDDIDNLWVKKDGYIIKNELRPLIHDLDSLPFADRALFRENIKGINKYNMLIIGSRGCPFSCAYCFNHAFRKLYGHDNIQAQRSVRNVIEEIKQCISTYETQFISFLDSIFVFDYDWLKEFSQAYRADIQVPFYCNIHPAFVNANNIKILAEAGCSVVGMGIESGDQDVRFNVLNRKVTDEKIFEAAKLIKGYGIKLATGNMLGIPQTDIKSDLKTLHMNIAIKPDYAMSYILSLHPGTDIFSESRRKLLVDIDPSVYYNGVHWSHTKKFSSQHEKRMTINLQNIFGFVVRYAFLYWLAPILIRLPLAKLYYLLHMSYEGISTFSYKRHRRNVLKRLQIHFKILAKRLKNYENINYNC